MKKSLQKVRVAVLAVDGFEQVEVTMPVAALRRAGADVRIISLRPGRIRGMNFIWGGRKLPVDDTVDNTRVDDYGALLLPGGFVNPDLLRQSEKVRQLVRDFDQAGRPIATLCHGPAVLISAGLVPGRRLTSWPGIKDDVRNAGGEWVDEALVRDRNWVSSRSPLDLAAFVPAMIDLFAESAPRIQSRLARRWRPAATIAKALTWGAIPLALVLSQKARAAARIDRVATALPARLQRPGWIIPAALAFVGVRRLLRGRTPRLTAVVSKGYRNVGVGAAPPNLRGSADQQSAPAAR